MTRPADALPVLTRRALNRATLARQQLLERRAADPVDAAGTLGGLQAQEPASPYIALWTRLVDFDPVALTAAFEDRRLVKAGLMRATLHAVPAADYLLLRPAVEPVFSVSSRLMRGAPGRPPAGAAPRRGRGGRRGPDAERRAARSPRRDGGHRRPRGPRGAVVVGPAHDAPDPGAVGRPVVVLAAAAHGRAGRLARPRRSRPRPTASSISCAVTSARFGPATVPDLAAWSRLAVARLRPAIASLEASGDLWHARDEQGRELLDLVDAPRPDSGVDAPPRLLAMWDSVLLAHADRSRLIDDAHRALVTATNGDTYPTFLVDGRVAGLWWTRHSGGGGPEVELEPFGRLAAADRRALDAEGAALAALIADREPTVYARYRSSRDRKAARGAAARGHRDLWLTVPGPPAGGARTHHARASRAPGPARRGSRDASRATARSWECSQQVDTNAIPEPMGWEDPLTGLEGPDFWQRVLVSEVSRALRYKRSLTVVVAEVDGVVAMADTWGNDVGRHAVREAAQCLRRASRSSDYCTRIGIARFGIVLTETDEIAAINFVERVRESGPAHDPPCRRAACASASAGRARASASPRTGSCAAPRSVSRPSRSADPGLAVGGAAQCRAIRSARLRPVGGTPVAAARSSRRPSDHCA